MALQPSGLITLSDIQDEFGGANPIGLSEYYRGGAYTTSNNTSVPTSGAISLSDFYGATSQFSFTISSNTQNANLATLATAAGWDGSAPILVTIASGVWIWSDSTSLGGLIIPASVVAGATIQNNGYIIGKGGQGGTSGGAGAAGGAAITNAVSNVIIFNNSGAYIAGGGGGGGSNGRQGGGGGAGGGNGGNGSRASVGTLLGGTGGAINNAGTNGQAGTNSQPGYGGGAGGGGGSGDNFFDPGGSGGGGGGRILPGVGGARSYSAGTDPSGYGGAGGSGGSAGENGANGASIGGGGGGGGWGAAGGAAGNSGGAGGAAGAAVSGTSVSMTNNGTIYGAVA
jgi:hypothetical protein